ncbi:DUF995 domain-containing protein [Ancylobacter oerskovii]|uniref:DUF995 domain-containing protein n=1 Tax=Ancylobacter oerskovii TaxID=459519 RepID=A0ABW4YZN2_9HYPH|nr:DUF995 domain-containing protein [Ancylobacter oerskovii]MBS7543926.1 DUF995 domain-containing protein [Ancylobacter oerskovii]
MMKSVLAAAVAAMLAAAAPPAQAQGPAPQAARKPAPAGLPGVAAIDALYSGKSWIWSDGAAYFSPNRKFVAWAGSGNEVSYVQGTWWVSPTGWVCFQGLWHANGPSGRNSTCFSHRLGPDKVLYQRREPGGDWYVFKHAQPVAGDEYAKFKDGDVASAGVARAKQELKRLRAASARN